MSYDNWKQTEPIDPFNEGSDEQEIEAEHFYPCSCGDPHCMADDRDKGNIRLGKAYYASDCELGQRLNAIADGREYASRADVARDDDFDQVRR